MALTQVSRGLLSTSIVDNGNATAITIDSSEDTTFTGRIKNTRGNHQAQLYGTGDNVILRHDSNSSGLLALSRAGSLDVVLDASGNLLVGKSSPNTNTAGLQLESDGYLSACRDGGNVVLVNRKSSDGALVTLQKDGTTVGSIGAASGGLFISSPVGNDSGLRFSDRVIHPCTTSGAPRDDAISLGYASGRFEAVYAANGTIQTSDRNEKQDIEALSDAEQRVAVAVKSLLRKYRWKSAVAEKNDDARIHFGIIAQDLQDAFTAEGLDAAHYGMWCSDTWTDEDTGEERTRLGVRYSELLAFIISAI